MAIPARPLLVAAVGLSIIAATIIIGADDLSISIQTATPPTVPRLPTTADGAAIGEPATAEPSPSATAAVGPSMKPKPDMRKWHPGNYLNAYWGSSVSWSIDRVTGNPNLKGVSAMHLWTELEPRKGVYDFSRIESELAAVAAAKKQLIVHVADRTIQGQACVPAYVRDTFGNGGHLRVNNKCTALRWMPAVQDRLIALYRALGAKFDRHPNFEAVMLSEDSMEHSPGYSDAGYVRESKRGMTALAKAFPHTVVFKSLNWGPGIPELFAHASTLGIGVGSPDLTPESASWAYPHYPKYAGKIPLQISLRDPRVIDSMRAGVTVAGLYDFAVTQPKGLHVNYIVWDQTEHPEISFQHQILPLIDARKGVTNARCPAAIRCR